MIRRGGPVSYRGWNAQIAALFWFGTGFADQPSPCRFCDIRRPSRARQVVDGLERSHGCHPADATCDPLTVDAEGRGDLAGIAAVRQVQDDGRALDVVRRSSARAGECRQGGAGFFRQRQRYRDGFTWHKAFSGIVTNRHLVGATPVVRSTWLEMRLAFDPMQGLRQRQPLEQAEPFPRVAVPGQVKAIPADVLQASKRRVEFRLI